MKSLVLFAVDATNLGLPQISLRDTSIQAGLQLVFGLAGGIALIIITLAGLQFVLARGEPQAIAKARNTIFYALAGLLVCIFAFSIVSLVLGRTDI